MSVHRKKYDSDCKRNAVLLSEDPDRTIAEIADNLCIARERLTKMRYLFIKKNRSSFTVKKMCQVMQVSQSGYYQWRKVPVSQRQLERDRIKNPIRELFTEHNGMAGSPMITADLQENPEFSKVSCLLVARLMREMGLRCHSVKKFVVTTDSKHNEPVAPNLLNRNFTVSLPNSIWVTDITYLLVGRKWHYLTVFIDLFFG